ncbi:AraC family transcriptional regulator [Piscinibacter sp. HJYY11]|uniref:AraC family transcriptional regulator n=1 Tax=Piscinibacter sp. HJYY11 TaxID=2801333 RepID=UPI00191DF34E|nr:AraC family transcriptional regulator [Piscinibacter sp. HJYY11]MBL0728239.1 AraC family transcriptional regulator [Piscinibacter sp. HJYY11]
MNAVPDTFDCPLDAAEFKRPARAGVELYRAHIVRHAFDPHLHEAFGLGVIDAGVERFRYRGAEHLASPGTLVLMNPGELHTGRAETDQGWRYRMVYLDEALLQAVTGERWWFADATAHDPAAAQRVSARLAALWHAPDALASDSALAELLGALRPHAQVDRALRERVTANDSALARSLALMHDDYASELTLDRLAAEAGLSPFHFLRRFKQRYHVTPHQMLMAVRLARAKQHLAAGMAPAEVAPAVGLADQAHLTKRFARMHGVTPARYRQQVQPQFQTRPRPRA